MTFILDTPATIPVTVRVSPERLVLHVPKTTLFKLCLINRDTCVFIFNEKLEYDWETQLQTLRKTKVPM